MRGRSARSVVMLLVLLVASVGVGCASSRVSAVDWSSVEVQADGRLMFRYETGTCGSFDHADFESSGDDQLEVTLYEKVPTGDCTAVLKPKTVTVTPPDDISVDDVTIVDGADRQ